MSADRERVLTPGLAQERAESWHRLGWSGMAVSGVNAFVAIALALCGYYVVAIGPAVVAAISASMTRDSFRRARSFEEGFWP